MNVSQKEFDAIIVGAGPGGAECARELSRRGRRVLLLERSERIGEPNFSTAGTPSETIRDFDFPSKVIGGSWSKILINADNNSHTWDYGKTRGYVFDFKELKKFLVGDAVKHGARVLVGTSAIKSIIRHGSVVGVSYEGIFGNGMAMGKVVVDASGPVGVLASELGLRKSHPCSPAVGIESIIENEQVVKSLKDYSNTLSVFLGDNYAPHGYGWIFPFGKNAFKVGICVFNAEDYGIVKKDYSDLMEDFEKFLGKFTQFKDFQITELHGGSIFVTGGLKKYSRDGFIAIGDAAFQINPLGGEGIRHALHSGRMAAEVINEALGKNNTKRSVLKEYDKKWNKYIGFKWGLLLKISNKIYGNFAEKQWSDVIKIASTLSPDEAYGWFFNYRQPQKLKLNRIFGIISMLKNIIWG